MVAPAIDEVEVWVVEFDAPSRADRMAAAVSPREKERYAALDRGAREIAVTTRATLREVLGGYLGVAPADIELVEAAAAKPALAGAELEFNVAHTKGVALLAVARVAVGIDIEHVEPIATDEFDDLLEFVLTARELDELVRLPERERLAAYYRVWTRKEAYVKATGEGIARRPLPEVVVGVADPTLVDVVGVSQEELGNWSVLDVDVPSGYVASLVVCHPRPRLTVRPWPPAA